MSTASSDQTNDMQFSIQRIYLKDCSFETPGSPDMFRVEWQPRVDFELQILHSALQDDVYEVVIAGTVTAKLEDKIAFLAEVKQAGIFTVQNIPVDQMPLILNVVAPNVLFPYFRETVSSLTVRGSFPQLSLDPINFEALYAQRLQQQMATGESTETMQ